MRPDLRLLALAVALASAGALAGCQGEKQAASKGTATAGGEVLPGSVSDAMLPIDAVRSQPPLAPKAEPGSKVGVATKPGARAGASQAAADAAPAAAPAGEGAQEPAVKPAAEAPAGE